MDEEQARERYTISLLSLDLAYVHCWCSFFPDSAVSRLLTQFCTISRQTSCCFNICLFASGKMMNYIFPFFTPSLSSSPPSFSTITIHFILAKKSFSPSVVLLVSFLPPSEITKKHKKPQIICTSDNTQQRRNKKTLEVRPHWK